MLRENMLSYHVVTGSDTVSQLSGQGKTTWKVFEKHSALLNDLGHGTLSESTILVWRSSSVEPSHQVLMKQTSTTSITVCFKREPRSKRSFLQGASVSNNTYTVYTTRTRCGICQMSHCPISSSQSGMDGMKRSPLVICIHSSV